MGIDLVSNLKRNNHLQKLLEIFKVADEIIIISPYLSKDFNVFPFYKIKHIQKLTLVTTLKGKSRDQYSKIPFFKELYKFSKVNDIELQINVENSLHGKIYISKSNKRYLKALITSANFTNNGLRLNNEWGIVIDAPGQIQTLEEGVLSKVVKSPLTEAQIDEFLKYLENNPLPNQESDIEIDLSKFLSMKSNPLGIDTNINYWLKPIGVSDNYIPIDRKFDIIDDDLYFSKRKPTGVKLNDILIAYAVGHKNILSIYRVKSELKTTQDKNVRWPYYFIGENLTPHYGHKWSNYDITISNQKLEVLSKGLFNITPSGKNSYGNLMRGGDRLRLTPEFGKYLIDKVMNIDLELKSKSDSE